ncbi:sedoheptulose-7-phosphate:D-glyceraldehyde-3- phosphate transaldolase [Tulasnella sp. 417]|nr:sedoheptulose-7-phosphate:D-glyceraldehyde-3- phosphate transaldolase [Tulasnella sp. 417]
MDRLLVEFGSAILKIIPGRVSTEVDARLFFDKEKTKAKARQLNKLYEENDISKERVLIKIASTWKASKPPANSSAVACAEAGFTLISPFVGRILDWCKARPENKDKKFVGEDDPGVQSVQKIFNYYKQHGDRTIVMGASFRNTGEIIALSGADFLTISPNLLEELKHSTAPVPKRLKAEDASSVPMPKVSFIDNDPEFRWELLKYEFQHLGLTPAVVESLEVAFPHIKTPELRGMFCYEGYWERKSPKTRKTETKSQTQLIIVPHRELAYQYQHWLQILTSSSPELKDYGIQLCIRGRSKPPLAPPPPVGNARSALTLVEDRPPVDCGRHSISISGAPSIVQSRTDKRWLTAKPPGTEHLDGVGRRSGRHAGLTAQGRLEEGSYSAEPAHPTGDPNLRWIYGKRKGNDGHDDERGCAVSLKPRPQLILASATLDAHARGCVFTQTNWLKRPSEERQGRSVRENDLVARLGNTGWPLASAGGANSSEAKNTLGDGLVRHSCVVVSETGESRKLDTTAEVEKEPFQPSSRERRTEQMRKGTAETLRSQSAATKPPSHLIQALAVQFALDIPSLALLVVPSTSSVRQIVEEFRELGVEAEAVELAESAKGRTDLAASVTQTSLASPTTPPTPAEPTNAEEHKASAETTRLLILNLSNTRGLGFSSLTHVFVLGTDVVKAPSDYTHIAGRVRRFGKGGHVITSVEDGSTAGDVVGMSGADESRMKRLYRKLDVDPTMVKMENM